MLSGDESDMRVSYFEKVKTIKGGIYGEMV